MATLRECLGSDDGYLPSDNLIKMVTDAGVTLSASSSSGMLEWWAARDAEGAPDPEQLEWSLFCAGPGDPLALTDMGFTGLSDMERYIEQHYSVSPSSQAWQVFRAPEVVGIRVHTIGVAGVMVRTTEVHARRVDIDDID